MMDVQSKRLLEEKKHQLEAARAELDRLSQEIQSFESMLDARLGRWLDQLTGLGAEIASLDEILQNIREERLYGPDHIRRLGAVPESGSHPGTGIPQFPWAEISLDKEAYATIPPPVPGSSLPDIRTVYHKLARRYHPDLARSEAERLQMNEKMAEVNRVYASGDLAGLMEIAGMKIPPGIWIRQLNMKEQGHRHHPKTEMEQVQVELDKVQLQIARLSSLPSVQLSLDVKLAAHQGVDLLARMAADLQHKVARRTAERDYLRSQVRASAFPGEM